MKAILKLIFLLAFISCSSARSFSLEMNKNGIDTTEIVNIGGVKQYISIKGKETSNPLLLYLHGGPGQSVMDKAEQITSRLQEKFIVVHWDQRGAGKTAELNKSSNELTIQLMQNDTEEIIQYLLKKFNRKKLYLVGHSWGSVLGFHIAQKSPNLLYAYVAISPPVNSLKSNRIALNLLKEHFKKGNNQKALKELSTVKIPNENLEQKIILYRWQTEFNGEKVTDEQVEQAMPFFIEWENNWGALSKQVDKINLSMKVPSLRCPIYFFVGKKDYQTNFSVTEHYFNVLKAPKKKLFWFMKSAHNVPHTEPDLMQKIIIEKILTETL